MKRLLVIGGGLLGLSCAKVLQDEGYDVIVLEAGEQVGLGCSHANGGMLTPSMSDPWNAPGVHRHLASSLFDPYSPMKLRIRAVPSLFFWGIRFLRHSTAGRHAAATLANYQLAQYATAKTTEIRERLGLQYEASSLGTLKIFRDRKAMEGPVTLARKLAASGLQFRELDAEGTVAAEPRLLGIRDKIAGALQFPDDQSGDAYLFCRALARELAYAGGEIRSDVTGSGLIVEKGKVLGVRTDAGDVMGDRVIVAAGGQTPALLKGTGISLPIRPAKGYSLTFDTEDIDNLPQIPVIDDAMHAAVTPLGNRLRTVGTAEFAGNDARIQPQRIDNLFRLLQALYPDIAAQVDRAGAVPWAGFRPMSCDGKPFIGPCAVEGLYINAGHGHLGWTMAMGSAHLLADLVAGRQPAIDGKPFQVDRLHSYRPKPGGR